MRFKSLFLAVLLMAAFCPGGSVLGYSGGMSWQLVSNMITARDQFTGCVIGNKIYVFGGNGNPDGLNLNSGEVYDITSNSWSSIASNTNEGIEELSGVGLNGKFYVFGGWGCFGTNHSCGVVNFNEMYNPANNTWTALSPKPTTTASAVPAVYAGKIYLFGGYYEDESPGGQRIEYSKVESYDPASNSWQYITDMPRVLFNPAIAVYGDSAYVIGGYNPNTHVISTEVMVYQFLSNKWTRNYCTTGEVGRVSSYASPTPVVAGKAYIAGGGEGTTLANHLVSDSVTAFDMTAKTWSSLPKLPEPRSCHITVMRDNTMYVIGGYADEDDEANGAKSSVYALSVNDEDVSQSVDLSGAYWFGSLSADVSTNIPWGKQGTVTVTGDNWAQEWDDQAGHHSFNSAFTTTVQQDGSINVNLSSGIYNIAWNGNLMIHSDSVPDAENRLGIDLLIRKATNVQSSDVVGEYSFFSHKLNWAFRADSVDWGKVIFNANGTASYNVVGNNGKTESGTVNWSLDGINTLSNITGGNKPSSSICENGIMAMSLFEAIPGDDPDFGYELFFRKITQTITRAEMADTYQVRFLETGPGGVPYTCGQGTCVLGANGSVTVDAYYSDGEYEQFNTTYTVSSGGKITLHGAGEGTISSDKGLVFIPEYDRPNSPGPDDWIGGIFLIRAAGDNQKFTLTSSVAGEHGTLLPASGSYDCGTVVNLTATADAGYWVKAWHGTDDDSLTTSSNTVTMNNDKAVTVEFEEMPENVLAITCLTVTAGKTRASLSDSLALKGNIHHEYLSFIRDPANNLSDITISIFSEDQSQQYGFVNIVLEPAIIKTDTKRTKISYKSQTAKGQPAISFAADLVKGAFAISGKNLDLTGFQSPVTVELNIGNYASHAIVYDGEASGSGGELDLINGAKSVPVQFMMGYANTLRVDKCVFVPGVKKPNTDKLTVQGTITVADESVDIAGVDVAVRWGSYSVVLPANDLYRLGAKMSYKYTKPKGSTSPVAAALFDLEKCVFKIVIANATIGEQGGPVDFGIEFDSFDEESAVSY